MSILEKVKQAKQGDIFGLIWHGKFKYEAPDYCVFDSYNEYTDTYDFIIEGRIHTFIFPVGEDNMHLWIKELNDDEIKDINERFSSYKNGYLGYLAYKSIKK